MSNIANKDAAITPQSSQQEEKLIAQVSAIKGQAYKQLAGHKQVLNIGDKIAIQSQLMTSDESAIAVRYQNGGGAILGSKQNVNLARLGQTGEAPQGEQDEELDFEALERAIESGSDLNELLPAAAAGGTASANSSAGTAGIRFIFTAEQVLPSAGFETNNFERTQPSQFDELTPSNQAPVAEDEIFSATEDTIVSGNLLANDSDVNNDPLSLIGFEVAGDSTLYQAGETAQIPGVGQITLNSDGSFEFIPNQNYNGPVPNISYTISDGSLTDTAQLIISDIQAINDAPIAIDDEVGLPEDGSILISVLQNDIDPDGDGFEIVSVGQAENGTVTIDPETGNPIYTANENYVGPDSFTYTITDPNGLQSTAVVRVTVGPNQNDSPIAIDDQRSTAEDTPISINVLSNDSDPDNDPLSVQGFSQGANGSVSLDPSTGELIYTPNLNFVGSDSFSYTITDPSGTTDTAIVTITVGPNINDQPIAIDDSITTPEDSAVTISVRDNDSDPENDPLTVTAVTQGSNGSVSIDPVSGNPIYTPNLNFVGIDSFTYTITDPSGASSTATVTVTVGTNVNDTPIAVDDSNSIDEDGTLTISAADGLLNNDSDPDIGDNISVIGLNGQNNNTGVAIAGSNGGLFVINPDGSYSFNSNGEFNQLATGETTTTSITYTISDLSGESASAVLTITIIGSNDSPSLSASITDQNNLDSDNNISLDISGNFTDIDGDSLTFSATGLPAGLSISAAGVITGTIDNSASQFGTAPNLGAHTVTISAQDPDGQSVSDTFIWQVNNPAPTATDDANSTQEDVAVNGIVANNDSDPDGDNLSYSLVNNPSNGIVVLNNDGTYNYTPNADFNGTDSFTYQVDDGEGGTDQATVVITVTPVNDAPVVDSEIDDQNNNDADVGINLDVSGNFADIDGDNLTFSAAGLPAGLSISAVGVITGTIDNSASQFGTAPNLGAHTVTITAQDPDGQTVSDTFIWQVNNPAPTATDDSNSTQEDTAVNGNVASNDNDPDGDNLSYSLVNNPSNGTVVLSSDGSYSYTPNADFNGTDSFTYQVDDGEGGTDQATVVITVTPVNDAPVVDSEIDDQTNDDADSSINLDISGNFADFDGDNLTFSATGLPAGLSISAAGVITGTIDNSASQFGTAPNLGAHTVTISAQDPDGQTVSDTFIWQINNPAPSATDDTNSTQEDVAVNGNVSTNDTDPDGDNLSYSLANNPSNGTVVLNNDGTYSYTPNADFNGTDSFTYQVDDGEGGTDQATVVITVTPVNDVPVVDSEIDDQNNNDADVGINLDISGNFDDIDGDNLTFSATGLPAGLSISAAGVITGTIDNSASQFGTVPNLGAHTVTITAQDPDGQTVSDTFIWQVNNPAPSATDDTNSTQEDTAVNGNVANNDSDPDGDDLNYSVVNNPSNGTVVLNNDGTYSYTPNADFNGTDSFTYQVDDGEGGTDQATVVITVTPVNDAPVVDSEIDDQNNNDADGSINLDISGNFADIDGDNLTFSATGLPAGLSISAAGVITGTIDNSASQFGTAPNLGAHTVTITAQDPDGQTVSDTFTWQVTNPAPSATDDSNSTQEDTAVNGNVASNDSDPDGDDLSYSILTSTSNGTLVFNNDGSYSYTPDADFNGSDSFTYEINDGEGGTDQATVLITVTPVNDAPIANDDSAITGQGQAVTINVVTNDTDVDSANLFVSHINGSAISEGQSIAIAGQGSVKLESGQLVFTPNANFMGEVNFDYTVSDGNLSDNASVVINVIAVDIKDDSGNDDVISSIDDLTQTMISGQIPSGGNITSLSIDSSNGGSLNVPLASITINPDGTFSALIDTSSLNDGDLTISLSASDSNGASASSSDQILKDTVTTVSIDPITINENGPSTITGSGEAGATIVISANGVVLGNTTVGGNGSWTFNTPAVLGTNINLISANATDVYGNTNNAERNLPRLVIDDENGAQDGHVTVDEAALADGSDPSLTTESATGEFTLTVAPDSLNKITVGGTDILSATLNTVSSTNPASHITINTPHGRIVISNFDQATGVVSYRFDLLDAQDHGNSDALNDPIVIEVHDDNGDVRSGTLNVNILDDQASASADGNASVEEGGNVVAHNSSGQSNLIANDIEGADEARIYDFEYLDENGVAQTANVTAGSSTTVQTQFGSLQVFSDGRWNFTSNTVNHSTDGLSESESFSYRLIDGDGDISSSSADKTIIISDTAPSFGATISGTVNEAGLSSGTNPAGVPTSVSGSLNLTTAADAVDTQFDSQIISSLEALNLQSGGQDLSYSLSANGHTLTASVNGQTVFTVQLNNTDSNSASYEFILSKAIDHDSSSTPISIDFALSVDDADGDSDNNTLSIVINDDIQLESINHTINEDSGTQIYNTNADATQANTSITINPSFGTASIDADGKLVYTPNQHYSGTDTLTYVTQEPGGISNTVTVTFTVNPRADRPNLSRDVATSFSDEDSIVALGFGLPQLVDTVDQNGNAANSGDNPERLGEILLRSIPAGTKILDGSNGNLELLSSTGADIKIAIVDGSGDLQPYMRSDISGSDILFLTETQFEQLALLPPAHSGTDFTARLTATSWEVNDAGTPLVPNSSATRTLSKNFDIQAVTDPVDIKINGSDTSHNATIDEDTSLDLAALLSTSFQDLDGSENRSIIISNPAGNDDIIVNGTVVSAGNSITINAPGLSSDPNSIPAITIAGAPDFSGDLNGINIRLRSIDTDSDSSGSINEEDDSVTLNLFVNPVAGDVSINDASGNEDSPIQFLSSLTVTDSGSGTEVIDGITLKALASGWILKDAAGNTVFTGDGSSDFSINNADIASGDFEDYTLQAPAHSSADISLELDISSTDSNTVNGLIVNDSKTVTLNQDISVTPIAENTTDDSDQNSNADFTITPGHNYSNNALEDTFFNLNSDGFALADDWSNEDSDEAVFAMITIAINNSNALALGSELRFINASGQSQTITYDGSPIEIPLASLASLEYKAPNNIAGNVSLHIQGKTVDQDVDSSASTSDISGSANLNFSVDPVADSTSLTVRPAQGNEDTPIALTIRPSSSDESETFNININDIPNGAQIIYDGSPLTILSGSITIVDFDQSKPLFFVPPLDSNADHVLEVEAFSVDTEGPISDTSPIVTLPLNVTVKGVADPANVVVTTPEVSEVTLDNNSGEIALSEVVTTALTTDIDGSEILSLKLTGLDAQFELIGAIPLGGSGTSRSWAIDPDKLNDIKLVVPENYSGTLNFNLSATTTDNDGATTTGLLIPTSVIVTPSPEAQINIEASLSEDTLALMDFSVLHQNGDTDEVLTSVWIDAAVLAASELQLFNGNGIDIPLADGQPGVILEDGYFKLTQPALDNIYVKGSDNYSGNQSLSILFEITDPSGDGTVPSSTVQSPANYSFGITAVTDDIDATISNVIIADPSKASFSGNTITATANTSFTVSVVIEKLPDSDANDNADIDGSETLQRLTIDNVPIGVSVENGVYVGNTDGNPDTAQWIIETSASFNSATISQEIVFVLDGNADKLADLNETISITAITADEPSAAISETVNLVIDTDVNFDDSDADDDEAADVNQWQFTDTPPTVNEDSSVSLADLIDANLGVAGSDFSVTLTNLPPGTQVSGMTLTSVDGVDVWTADGVGSDTELQALLASISITPPANFNSNIGNLTFNASLTSYAPGGERNDSSTLVDQEITPVSDPTLIEINTSNGQEDAASNFTISLSNTADGASANIVDNSLYIAVDESNINPVGSGTLSYEGTTLSLQVVSGVPGVPDGQYYIIDNVSSANETLNLSYQAPTNSHGEVSLQAFVNNQQTGASNIASSQSEVAAIEIAPINDGFDLTASNINGAEDTEIELQLGGSGLIDNDGSEIVDAVILSGLPDGFIVKYGADAGSAQIANNTGDNGNNNSWAIPAIANNLPAYIAILPPENWSGSLSNLQVGVLSREQGLTPTLSTANFELTVDPVADGLSITPATSFGNEGEIIPLQLNPSLLDTDGSETVTLTLTGLGEFAAFYSEGQLLNSSYDQATDSYTLNGLTEDQLNDLGLIQSANHSGTITVTASTQDGGDTSASVNSSATINITAVNPSANDDSLLYDGNAMDAGDGEDTLILRLGEDIDFSNIANLSNFEIIDLMPNGQHHNLIAISLQDVLDITDDNNVLIIKGDDGDSVSFENGLNDTWTSVAGTGSDAGYDIYTNSADPSVIVKVEAEIVDTII